MQLSSFTQYYIRRLLRQYLQRIKYQVGEQASVQRYLKTDLNLIMQRSGGSASQLVATLEEIETLVEMHRQSALRRPQGDRHQAQLEQKIYELIGLRLRSFLPASRLVTAREDGVRQFKFLWEGKLQDGIQYNDMLYGLILESKFKHDLNIYQMIAALSKAEVSVILTIAPERYAVWIDLRSPAYSILNKHGMRLFGKVSKLHATLCKFQERKIQIISE